MIYLIYEEPYQIKQGPSKGMEIWIRHLTSVQEGYCLTDKLKWVVRDYRGFAMPGDEAERLYNESPDLQKKVGRVLGKGK